MLGFALARLDAAKAQPPILTDLDGFGLFRKEQALIYDVPPSL